MDLQQATSWRDRERSSLDPKDFERKFREFMKREMPGYYYQSAICYTSAKPNSDGNIQITNQTIGFDIKDVPFSIAHALFKSLEATVSNMVQNIYGPTLTTSAIKEKLDSAMHR